MQIPKNVIQTGEPDPCHKIYVEDYVHTLLTQYRENEADFCLYGKLEQEGEITYYFIYGAAKEEPGWELMESRYFALQHRIGEATFDEKEAWAFFEDGYSAPLNGFFIFYEQNEDMQSYLIAMHQNRPGEKAVTFRHKAVERAEKAVEKADEKEKEKDGGKEPRRILRRPEQKELHAAQSDPQTGGRTGRYRQTAGPRGADSTKKAMEREERTGFRIKATAAAVLLGLCAAAITSANEGQKAETAGNFFTQTPGGEGEEKENDGAGSDIPEDDVLVVEETQLSTPDIAPAADSLEVETAFAPAADSRETETASIPAEAETEDSIAEEEPAPLAAEASAPETVSAPPEEASAPETASASPEEVPEADTVTYIVRRGDNLAEICRRQYGSTDRLKEIAALNQLADPNHLIPGQQILLPQ